MESKFLKTPKYAKIYMYVTKLGHMGWPENG